MEIAMIDCWLDRMTRLAKNQWCGFSCGYDLRNSSLVELLRMCDRRLVILHCQDHLNLPECHSVSIQLPPDCAVAHVIDGNAGSQSVYILISCGHVAGFFGKWRTIDVHSWNLACVAVPASCAFLITSCASSGSCVALRLSLIKRTTRFNIPGS